MRISHRALRKLDAMIWCNGEMAAGDRFYTIDYRLGVGSLDFQ